MMQYFKVNFNPSLLEFLKNQQKVNNKFAFVFNPNFTNAYLLSNDFTLNKEIADQYQFQEVQKGEIKTQSISGLHVIGNENLLNNF